ncbi:MAG: hypothetical protein KTR14_01260 [Vampirovibrio sp.]|nr:hypothetical protein [Vampirovibrio sp.]
MIRTIVEKINWLSHWVGQTFKFTILVLMGFFVLNGMYILFMKSMLDGSPRLYGNGGDPYAFITMLFGASGAIFTHGFLIVAGVTGFIIDMIWPSSIDEPLSKSRFNMKVLILILLSIPSFWAYGWIIIILNT